MLCYRILRTIHRGYPLAVFWIYVALFFLAMSLMFVFPPGTLILLGLSLASLVAVILIAKLLGLLLHLTARVTLNAGVCPGCGHRSEHRRDTAAAWQCEHCGVVFLPNGTEVAAPGV